MVACFALAGERKTTRESRVLLWQKTLQLFVDIGDRFARHEQTQPEAPIVVARDTVVQPEDVGARAEASRSVRQTREPVCDKRAHRLREELPCQSDSARSHLHHGSIMHGRSVIPEPCGDDWTARRRTARATIEQW